MSKKLARWAQTMFLKSRFTAGSEHSNRLASGVSEWMASPVMASGCGFPG
jgi:hypothetical protein